MQMRSRAMQMTRWWRIFTAGAEPVGLDARDVHGHIARGLERGKHVVADEQLAGLLRPSSR